MALEDDGQVELYSLRRFPSPTPTPVTKTHPNGVTVAEAIDRVDSAFIETTGNIAAIDFGTANCSLAYCTTKDEQMRLLKLSSQEGQVRVPTILLVNDKGEPIKFGARAIRQYQRLDPSQQLKYHLFERVKLALGPHEVPNYVKIVTISSPFCNENANSQLSYELLL